MNQQNSNKMHRLIILLALLSNVAHAEPTTVIHVLNWHFVSLDDFAADLKANTGKPLTDDQIKEKYWAFQDDLKAIQNQQIVLLRQLIKKHKLKSVYIEGLTEKNKKEVMGAIESLKEYEKNKADPNWSPPLSRGFLELFARQDKLELGAAGQLVVKGELDTLLPAEDSKAFEVANPVRSDGKVIFDKMADERREDAIVSNLLKGSGVVVIVLGEDHDLTDNIKRLGPSVEYRRVGVPKAHAKKP